MPDVIGIDHIYLAVSDLAVSEVFYDEVLIEALGFRKTAFALSGEPHIQYFNRHFGIVIRPGNALPQREQLNLGLHHLCFRVESSSDVEEVAGHLRAAGIDATPARAYPVYAPDYVATYFSDPDGIRLEVTNYREERRARHDAWDSSPQ
jgi:catechol 2,3-dioxygenase-like lactoylglutathione lyase family enzyme